MGFNKRTFLVALSLLLACSLGMRLQIQSVRSSTTIYIRGDGNVDPGGAPIQRDGDLYTVTTNISSDADAIIVERDNIVLDGACHTVRGSATYFSKGVALSGRMNVTIRNMNVEAFFYGIYLNGSSYSLAVGNNLTKNFYGLRLYMAFNDTFVRNNLTDNSYGASIGGSFNNTFFENNVGNNKNDGMDIGSSYNNTFYHNNFFGNQIHVFLPGGGPTNVWNLSGPYEGNFWGNDLRTDSNHDGISETPHENDPVNIDMCPLMGPFKRFDALPDVSVSVVSNSTIEHFEYSEPNSTIILQVSNSSSAQLWGFVRACIPRELLDVNRIEVAIDDDPTLVFHANYTLYDNGTHRWIYFAYEHSTHTIMIIPELRYSVILAVFASTFLCLAKRGSQKSGGRRAHLGMRA